MNLNIALERHKEAKGVYVVCSLVLTLGLCRSCRPVYLRRHDENNHRAGELYVRRMQKNLVLHTAGLDLVVSSYSSGVRPSCGRRLNCTIVGVWLLNNHLNVVK